MNKSGSWSVSSAAR